MRDRDASGPRPRVVAWFGTVASLIALIIAVGGITRLTQSGLSMVTWDPIMGAIPPLSHEAWLQAFHKYQQFPQYKLTFSEMDLAGFQKIFFWEYLHRLIGRGIGLAVLIPGVWLALRRRLDRKLGIQFAWMLVLVLAQGALGWFMVRSGLKDVPHVSQFRLAAHLSMALTMLAYVLWALFGELERGRPQAQVPVESSSPSLGRVRTMLTTFELLLGLQIFYGALTAGLRAGFGYNTWPKMYGVWLPDAAFALRPMWMNAFENPAAVQFIHRTVAVLVVLASLGLWLLARSAPLARHERRWLLVPLGLVAVQFVLGVATLLSFVAVPLASLHQLVGCLLFAATVRVHHVLRSAGQESVALGLAPAPAPGE